MMMTGISWNEACTCWFVVDCRKALFSCLERQLIELHLTALLQKGHCLLCVVQVLVTLSHIVVHAHLTQRVSLSVTVQTVIM